MRKSSIYLPDELKHDLAELAARTGRPEAELIRQAIERLVAVTAGAPAQAPATAPVLHPRPALVGVGVGPGDPGLVTARARATLVAADRVLVITTDARSIGRAEMVVRSVAPTASIQRVPFAIGADTAARRGSLDDVKQAALAGLDAGELVAVAVLGDATQWTIFPDLAEAVGAARPGVTVAMEPGITSYQAAAADALAVLGRPAGAMVVVDRVDDLDRHLGDPAVAVVVYKATTEAVALKELASRHQREGAVVAELTGLPGHRLQPLDESDDGPISYLATVLFPARSPQPTRVAR